MWNLSRNNVSFRYGECVPNRSFILQQSTYVDVAPFRSLSQKDWRLAFYEMNYEAIAAHIQEVSPKVTVGSRDNKRCRFCGKDEASGKATFKQEAHGFPGLVGNRTFFTNYECDACNKDFGDGIENQLGIYLKPYRTLAAIRGRKKFPTIKNEKEGWKIWRDSRGLNIHHQNDRRIFEMGEDGKTITIRLPRDAYKPLDVYKALTKMALSLMPEDEIGSFRDALGWIKGEGTFRFIPPTVSTTFVEGPPVNTMSALLLRRRSEQRELPYLMALFPIANTQFQFMVPCIEKDNHLLNKRMSFPSYPLPPEIRGEKHRVHFEEVDFSEERMIKDESVTYEFAFDERIETTEAKDP